MKPILVQKFGGTSLGSPDRVFSLISIVKHAVKNYQLILVVSAISGKSKAEGSTNLLLRAAKNAVEGLSYEKELASLRDQHLFVINQVIGSHDSKISEIIDLELNSLKEFLVAIAKIGEVSNKSLDKIISLGEKLSSLVISRILEINGLNAVSCDLSEVLNEAEIDPIELREVDKLYSRCTTEFKNKISNLIDAKNSTDLIPVVTGFFGRLPNGILEVIGRGYSDLTAALVAKSFSSSRVKELQIWKEVDGVFTADPRKVASAKVLDFLSPVEAAELTFFGSEVIHPYTMEQVTSVGIPIRVLNSLKPDDLGTLIKDSSNVKLGQPTAVTAKSGVTVLSVTSNRMYDAKGFLMKLFSILDEFDLVVDLVSTSEITVSCTVNDHLKLKMALEKLESLGKVEIREGRAILALVGEGLQKQTFSASYMLKALSAGSIPVEMITQATTQMSISCVIEESLIPRALNIVHDALFTTSS